MKKMLLFLIMSNVVMYAQQDLASSVTEKISVAEFRKLKKACYFDKTQDCRPGQYSSASNISKYFQGSKSHRS